MRKCIHSLVSLINRTHSSKGPIAKLEGEYPQLEPINVFLRIFFDPSKTEVKDLTMVLY